MPGLVPGIHVFGVASIMDLHAAAMLFGAGIAGGALAGLIGGASIITFPVLLAIGLPPVIATATNLVAVTPGNVSAVLLDRSQLPPFDRTLVGLIATTIAGAVAGSILLMLTPARVFEILVPLLLGFATVLLALSPQVSQWLRTRAAASGGELPRVTSGPMLIAVSIYGGYFGAGVGVLLLAALTVATGGDYRAANATKNLVLIFNTLAAAVVLGVQHAVNWPAALVMMAGAFLGGFLGGYLGRIAAPQVMRVVMVAAGAILTAAYAWRYWF